MQIMAEKGLVRRNEKQRAHIYEPAKPREWTQRQLAGDLLAARLRWQRPHAHDGRAFRAQGLEGGTGGAAQAAR